MLIGRFYLSLNVIQRISSRMIDILLNYFSYGALIGSILGVCCVNGILHLLECAAVVILIILAY